MIDTRVRLVSVSILQSTPDMVVAELMFGIPRHTSSFDLDFFSFPPIGELPTTTHTPEKDAGRFPYSLNLLDPGVPKTAAGIPSPYSGVLVGIP